MTVSRQIFNSEKIKNHRIQHGKNKERRLQTGLFLCLLFRNMGQ